MTIADGAAARGPARGPEQRPGRGPLVYRQRVATRVAHWLWAVALFFLLLSGLQIFGARPDLYLGRQSGFAFDNAILSIGARQAEDGSLRGVTDLFGWELDTTGVLGVVGGEARTFPGWMTIPSYHDLATGRVVHFFFAWVLVGTLGLWWGASLWTRHAGELIPTRQDLRDLPRDVRDHARLRFHHGRRYNVLQKLAYAGTLFVLLPLMIVTGLCMSPSFNAVAPWLPELFGGRQTARTVHFLVMLLLVGFFVVHILMVLAAGPLNELRSILTGWYRIDPDPAPEEDADGR